MACIRDTLERDFGGDPEVLPKQVERALTAASAHHLGWGERGVGGFGTVQLMASSPPVGTATAWIQPQGRENFSPRRIGSSRVSGVAPGSPSSRSRHGGLGTTRQPC